MTNTLEQSINRLEQAVEIACKIDNASGLPLQIMRVENEIQAS